jgi:hypothetical protein
MKNLDIPISEGFGIPVAHVKHPGRIAPADEKRIKELELQILDLTIANRGKHFLIDQLKGERTGFLTNFCRPTEPWVN